jgi:hypothetical protein
MLTTKQKRTLVFHLSITGILTLILVTALQTHRVPQEPGQQPTQQHVPAVPVAPQDLPDGELVMSIDKKHECVTTSAVITPGEDKSIRISQRDGHSSYSFSLKDNNQPTVGDVTFVYNEAAQRVEAYSIDKTVCSQQPAGLPAGSRYVDILKDGEVCSSSRYDIVNNGDKFGDRQIQLVADPKTDVKKPAEIKSMGPAGALIATWDYLSFVVDNGIITIWGTKGARCESITQPVTMPACEIDRGGAHLATPGKAIFGPVTIVVLVDNKVPYTAILERGQTVYALRQVEYYDCIVQDPNYSIDSMIYAGFISH